MLHATRSNQVPEEHLGNDDVFGEGKWPLGWAEDVGGVNPPATHQLVKGCANRAEVCAFLQGRDQSLMKDGTNRAMIRA